VKPETNLLPATSNVIVPNVGKVVLLVLPLDGVTLGVNDGVLSDDAEL
jgi:hypothetical protein